MTKADTERNEKLTRPNNSGRDPSFYKQKRAIEKILGRELTTAEFEENYYVNEQKGGGLSETGTSVFDPVLAEIAYTWFCPQGGAILDPFAGGSVRGIVASALGYKYKGVDLSSRQVEANRRQAEQICKMDKEKPEWIVGDSAEIDTLAAGEYDFVFSCPPYADLERYSNDPRDISNMEYDDFCKAYEKIITRSVSMLKKDRFAVFVVGDIRDKKGFYRNFIGETISAFELAGMKLYNHAVIINQSGSLPVTAGRAFEASRKIAKQHQNFLVFNKDSGDGKLQIAHDAMIVAYSGDPKKIKDTLPHIEFNESDITIV